MIYHQKVARFDPPLLHSSITAQQRWKKKKKKAQPCCNLLCCSMSLQDLVLITLEPWYKARLQLTGTDPFQTSQISRATLLQGGEKGDTYRREIRT